MVVNSPLENAGQRQPTNKGTKVCHALEYALNGIPVFPCTVKKNPLTQHGYKDATCDPVKVFDWWKYSAPLSIGVPTGSLTGFWVLDVDLPRDGSDNDGHKTLQGLIEAKGELPQTVAQQTGGGGEQFFFAMPQDGEMVRNSVGKIGPGLDVRGEGGYVIVPPSGHPSNGVYFWEAGQSLLEGEPATAPDWLLDLVRSENANSRGQEAHSSATPSSTAYGEKALARQLEELSQTPKGKRNDTLNRVSFGMGRLIAGGQLDHSRAEVALLHAALDLGLTEREAARTIKSGLGSGQGHPQLPAGHEEHGNAGKDTAHVLPALPSIPIEIFPKKYRQTIQAAARAFGVPNEVPATALLALTSACIGRTRRIVVKESWGEHPNLYLGLVARSGVGKSPCCKVFFKTVRRLEKQWHDRWQADVAKYEAVLEAQKKFKGEGRDNVGSPLQKPALRQLILDDATIESVANAFTDNPRGLLWYRDELFGLLADMDKYAGEKGGTRSRLLSAYDSEPWKTNRISARAAYIPHACLSIFGTIQPALLGKIFSSSDQDSGFLARFLFAFAEPEAPPQWVDEAFDHNQQQAIDDLTEALLKLEMVVNENGEERPVSLEISPEGKDKYKKWFNDIGLVQWYGGGEKESICAKLRGQALRLALILHHLAWMAGEAKQLGPVNATTMDGALALSNWFLAQQMRAYQMTTPGGSVKGIEPRDVRVARAILASRADIDTGFLANSDITEAVNQGLEPGFTLKPEQVGKICRGLGLVGRKRSGGVRGFVLDAEVLIDLETLVGKKTAPTAPTAPAPQKTIC